MRIPIAGLFRILDYRRTRGGFRVQGSGFWSVITVSTLIVEAFEYG